LVNNLRYDWMLLECCGDATMLDIE